jgi:hypothetical protein
MCAFTPRSRCWTIDARGDAATGTEDAEVSSQEGQEEQRCREQRAGPARQADQPRDLVGTHAEGGRDVQLLEGVIDDPPEIDASSGRPLAEGPGGRLLHPALVQGQPVGPEQGEQLARGGDLRQGDSSREVASGVDGHALHRTPLTLIAAVIAPAVVGVGLTLPVTGTLVVLTVLLPPSRRRQYAEPRIVPRRSPPTG